MGVNDDVRVENLEHKEQVGVRKKRENPLIVCSRTTNLLGEFEAANCRDEASDPDHQEAKHWIPPTQGVFKLNSDAATASTTTGLGIVVRDHIGDVLMVATRRFDVDMQARVAEVKAIRFGINYAYDAGFRTIKVKTYCQSIVKLLKAQGRERTYIQVIVDDILAKVGLFNAISFQFVRRTCNREAIS